MSVSDKIEELQKHIDAMQSVLDHLRNGISGKDGIKPFSGLEVGKNYTFNKTIPFLNVREFKCERVVISGYIKPNRQVKVLASEKRERPNDCWFYLVEMTSDIGYIREIDFSMDDVVLV